MDITRLSDDITEAVTRLALHRERKARGVTCPNELAANDWHDMYSGRLAHHMTYNVLQKEVDHTVAKIMDSIHNHSSDHYR